MSHTFCSKKERTFADHQFYATNLITSYYTIGKLPEISSENLRKNPRLGKIGQDWARWSIKIRVGGTSKSVFLFHSEGGERKTKGGLRNISKLSWFSLETEWNWENPAESNETRDFQIWADSNFSAEIRPSRSEIGRDWPRWSIHICVSANMGRVFFHSVTLRTRTISPEIR